MSSPFDQRVQKNMDHMGTTMAQWSSVEIASTARTTSPGMSDAAAHPNSPEPSSSPSALDGAYLGHRVQIGTLEAAYAPVNPAFKPAPSLFAGKNCCWLCGTSVKDEFLVQNQERGWVMPVGSECVGRFEGISAVQSAKEHQWAQQRATFTELRTLRKQVWSAFAVKQHEGYGRYTTRIPPYGASAKAHSWYTRAKELMGSLTETSTTSALSRWFNTHSKDAYLLIEEGSSLMQAHQIQQEQRQKNQKSQAQGLSR
jgi:hypothetical protein